MEEITHATFDDIINSSRLSIIKIGASYCDPCNRVAPILDNLSKTNTDILFGDINIEEEPELATMLGIRSIPTILFYRNGTELKKHIGTFTKQQMEKIIEEI